MGNLGAVPYRYKRLIAVLVLVVLTMGWSTTVVYGQEFVGTGDCNDCHRRMANDHAETAHANTLVGLEEVDEDTNPIVGDFAVGDDLRTITFPNQDDARPFEVDDVTYTLGVGRHIQAYVTRVDDNLFVLPAQWNNMLGEWESLDYAESWPDPAYDFVAECAGCHVTGLDSNSLEWQETGVQCEACHGPGENHVEFADDAGSSISDEEYAEISGAINFALDAQVCGQCHVRGLAGDGIHPYALNYLPGDSLLDEDIYVPAVIGDDSHWLPSGHARLPNMQFNEWLQSGHPSALSTSQESEYFAAECIVCHSVAQARVDYLIEEDWVDEDEFDPLTVLDEHGFGITCASCHNPHETEADSLLRDEAYPLCTSCHSNSETAEGFHHPVQEMFEGQQFVEEIEPVVGGHFGDDDGPRCVTCHMPSIDTKSGPRSSHTFHIVSPGIAANSEGLQDSCTTCHSDVENPAQMQDLIDSVQSNVSGRLVAARENLGDNTADWVVAALDAVEGDGSRGIHNYNYTNAMLTAVETELGLVSGSISDADVSAQVDAVLPDMAPAALQSETAGPAVPSSTGLTAPSILLLAIAGLIIAIAAYAFYVRGGRDD